MKKKERSSGVRRGKEGWKCRFSPETMRTRQEGFKGIAGSAGVGGSGIFVALAGDASAVNEIERRICHNDFLDALTSESGRYI